MLVLDVIITEWLVEWLQEKEGHQNLMVFATAGLNFAMDFARYVRDDCKIAVVQ